MAFIVGVAVAVAVALSPVSGQGPQPSKSPRVDAASPRTANAAKTPWGEPDIQGLWTNKTITPLERPRDLGTKEFYTADEILERERLALIRATDEARGADAKADVAGAYNDFWWDRGTKDINTNRTSLIVSPANGRIPWRPEVMQQNAERGKVRDAMLASSETIGSWLDVDTGERCITDGIPWTPGAYNNNYLIVQSPGNVAITHEMYRELRVFTVGDRPRASIPQWFGNSSAHWQGNTLVVETENFADKSAIWWPQAWRKARPTFKVTERFTRGDAGTLVYEFTVTDPTPFTDPWTAQVPMTKAEGRIFEYACHEGNHAMTAMLGNNNRK
ncbi:MAG: hypothetical protein GEU82_06240 [Luteitalea sp.]|nr:hypothetical protein [Luteitalea sp.]